MINKEIHFECNQCPIFDQTVFNGLEERELSKLSQSKSSRCIKKGQVVFSENDLVKGLHCIRSGKIKLFKTADDGDMQILKISKEGEIVGYRGLLGNGRYIATAETLEEAEICFIPKHTVLELLSSNLHFSLKLMSTLASDISTSEDKFIRLVQKSSKERLAEAILMLEAKFGVDPLGFIQISLTRQEMGAYSGLASETIIRALRAWEEEGVLNLDKKKIRIVDRARLITISNHPE